MFYFLRNIEKHPLQTSIYPIRSVLLTSNGYKTYMGVVWADADLGVGANSPTPEAGHGSLEFIVVKDIRGPGSE